MPDPTVRIRAIGHLTEAARSLCRVKPEVLDALYVELRSRIGSELAGGAHTDMLSIEGSRVRVNLFADSDGTLWVTAVETA